GPRPLRGVFPPRGVRAGSHRSGGFFTPPHPHPFANVSRHWRAQLDHVIGLNQAIERFQSVNNPPLHYEKKGKNQFLKSNEFKVFTSFLRFSRVAGGLGKRSGIQYLTLTILFKLLRVKDHIATLFPKSFCFCIQQ
ncbi:MAG: hypothetical protein AB3N11_07425, partial [Arenibacterium sp.]